MKNCDLKYPQSVYGVMAFLSAGPRSGYDIRKALEHPEMYFWKESYGNVYPILKILFNDGLVDKEDSYVKTKKRVIYKLNERGRKELLNWITEPIKLNRFRVELIMKLHFGINSGVDNLISQLIHYKKLNERELEESEHIFERIDNSPETLTGDMRRITMAFLTGLQRTSLAWCDESIEVLKKWEKCEKAIDSNHGEENTPLSLINSEPFLQDRKGIVSPASRNIPPMK